MKISVYAGIPGSKKSLTLLDRIIQNPGRHLWAAPRRDLLDEQASYVKNKAQQRCTPLVIETIHSGQKRERSTVARRVADALKSHNGAASVVVLITHETLLTLDPSPVAGWHVYIDEVPDSCVLSGSFSAPASCTMLGQHYRLTPVGDGKWSSVSLSASAARLRGSEITSDVASGLTGFHKAASSSGRAVLVDLDDWQNARSARRKVRWWSVWTPTSLRAAVSVSITGAGFFSSLAYYAATSFHGAGISFERAVPPNVVQRGSQTFIIRYFAQHAGSTPWWKSDEGSRCLVEVSRHLEKIGFAGYWSCNAEIRAHFQHRIRGAMCEPKQAGTNNLRHHRSCAFIYSNKAGDGDEAILEVLGLDRDAVQTSREFEDIKQFVMRGAPRDPAFSGEYEVFLCSRDQAERLRDYLLEQGVTSEVVLEAVEEAGIMDVVRPRSKRQRTINPTGPSHRQREARWPEGDKMRKREARAEARAQKIEQGTYRGRGRPLRIKPEQVRQEAGGEATGVAPVLGG